MASALLGDPDEVAAPHQADQARHHVRFDMAVKKVVALDAHAARIRGRIALEFFERARQPQGGRRLGVGDEGSAGLKLCTSAAPPGGAGSCQRVACGWKLCHVSLKSRLKTYQRRRSPDSTSMVGVLPTKARPLRQKVALPPPPEKDDVLAIAIVRPGDGAAGRDGDRGRVEEVVADVHRGGGGAAGRDMDRPAMVTPWMRQW